MQLFTTQQSLKSFLSHWKSDGLQLSFVPTMGALHDGHLSLMKLALQNADALVISIFVNPTQFNNASDLLKYPRNVKKDVALIEKSFPESKICVYAPTVEDVYGARATAKTYDYDGLDQVMEGANRPGHFDGVGTILEFLFKLIKPQSAVFGEKDFQQLQIVRKLVSILNLPVKIIGAPISREKNMLAMSSRNERLDAKHREDAGFIYNTLSKAHDYFKSHGIKDTEKFVKNQFKNHSICKLEYVEIANENTLQPALRKNKTASYRIFIAVFIEDVRLIDNLSLN